MATILKTAYFSQSSYIWIELSYDVLSQDNDNLQSELRYYLRFKSGNASGGGSSASGYINGDYVGGVSSIRSYDDILVGTKDVTIQHSSDGTATANYSASLITNWVGAGSASLSGSFAVPSLSGVSKINSISGEQADIQGNYDIEGVFSVDYTKYVQSYTQKLRISIPYVTALTTINNYESGANFELGDYTTSGVNTITYLQNYMNTKKIKEVTLGFVIESWKNGTKVGESVELTNKVSFKNAEPVLTYTLEETDESVTDLLGTSATSVIQNASKVKITLTAQPQKGSTIQSMKIGNATQTGSQTTMMVIFPITNNSIAIQATDIRGNVTTQAITWEGNNFIEYQSVDISPDFKIKRVTITGSTIRFNLTARYYQQTFGSHINEPHLYYKLNNNAQVEIPKKDQTHQQGYEINNTTHTLTLTDYDVENLLDYTQSGQFVLTLVDLLTSDEEGGTNGYVLKGIPTFEAGEHDFQVNGDLIVADANGQNGVNVLEAINKIDVYTTTERVVGTWINNELLYRKVVTFSNVGTSKKEVSHNISNIDTIVNFDAIGITSSGASYRLPMLGGNGIFGSGVQITCRVNKTNIEIQSTNSYDHTFYFVIYYTKVSS